MPVAIGTAYSISRPFPIILRFSFGKIFLNCSINSAGLMRFFFTYRKFCQEILKFSIDKMSQ